jgi:hypothetical protein
VERAGCAIASAATRSASLGFPTVGTIALWSPAMVPHAIALVPVGLPVSTRPDSDRMITGPASAIASVLIGSCVLQQVLERPGCKIE